MAVKASTLPRSEVQRVLNLLRKTRSFDFSGYKRSTLHRRIEGRMRERRCVKAEEYCQVLQREPAEVDALTSALLIKVTDFFRDPVLWEKLRKEILPPLLVQAAVNGEMRVWSAGCATGEEAYSIAMLLADLAKQQQSNVAFRVFGTDRDASAIAAARRGMFNLQQVRGLPPQLLDRWFDRASEGYMVRKDLRRYLVFGVHDVVNNAPISRIDLILCRNLFIYLDAVAQRRALINFHRALKHEGILALGKSELIPFADKLFAFDLSSRIYRRLPYRPRPGEQALTPPIVHHEPELTEHAQALCPQAPPSYREALMALDVAVVVLNKEGIVTVWNDAAARLWGRRESDVVGRPLSEIKWDELAARHLLERVATMRTARGHVTQETFLIDGERPRSIRLEVTPLHAADHVEHLGFVFLARDVTELQQAQSVARQAEERQREASGRYQGAIAQLQSTNEELETTNEELQSANAELETINEELQSTNASLDAVNSELGMRTMELDRANLSQKTMIEALSAAVIGFDGEGNITLWNPAAERMFDRSEDQLRDHNLQRMSLAPIPWPLATRIKRALARKTAVRVDRFEAKVNGRIARLRCDLIQLNSKDANYGAILMVDAARQPRRAAAQTAKKQKRAVASAKREG